MTYSLELRAEEVFSLEQALGCRIIQLCERMEEAISEEDTERYNQVCEDMDVCRELAIRVHEIGNQVVEAFEETVVAENLETLDQELEELFGGGQ